VAASLDSMVVGEQQILGQVKEAYGLASAASAAGSFMSRLCNRAFATAKRVRTETDIGRGATSMSQVAVDLVAKIFSDLEGRAILLVGAGKMGALSAKALRVLGADSVLVTNRSPERGQALADQVEGTFRPWEQLDQLLTEADVVIVSTGAPSYVLTAEQVRRAMKARRHRNLCLIDLAVPRNVDPACAELGDVYAYDVDDLDRVVSANHEARRGEAVRAEAIVEAEVIAFTQERETRAALPVLAELRQRAARIARAEAERTLASVGGKLDEKGRRSVEAMAQAIVNKLLHGPTSRLKDAAASGDSSLPGAAAALFGLEEQEQPPRARRGGEQGAAPGAASTEKAK
jgi:glutamyl-tRNA reductase